MTNLAAAGYRPSAAVAKSSVGYEALQHAIHTSPSHNTLSGLLRHDFHWGFLVYFTFPVCQNEAKTAMVLQNAEKA